MKKSRTSKLQVYLLEEAKIDVWEASSFYDAVLPGLGKRFLLDFKHTVQKIKANPFSFGYRYEQFRTANFKTFPYQVHYLIQEENLKIILFAVLHGFRSPTYIKSRSK
jgi:hypothetical protein